MQQSAERKRYRIHGRVQGVGFRAWVIRHAHALELAGWVSNRPDGAVELEAAGSAAAMARLRELLGEGPRLARVDRVEELPPSPRVLDAAFEVVY